MTREEVYQIINGERDYQEIMKEKHGTVIKSPGEFLLIIQGYMQEIATQNMNNAGWDPILIGLRKIAALAVACMEENGGHARGNDPDSKRWREQ